MSTFVKAIAALALTFSLTTTNAFAGEDALNIAKVGEEAADSAFGKADTLNNKLINGKKTLDEIKAKVADASNNPTVLKGAETDLTALATDLKSIPDDIKAIINEAKGVKLTGNFLAKGKKTKAIASNVVQLGKVTKNASALISAVNETSAEVAKSAKEAAANATEAAGDAVEAAGEAAEEAAKEAAGQ